VLYRYTVGLYGTRLGLPTGFGQPLLTVYTRCASLYTAYLVFGIDYNNNVIVPGKSGRVPFTGCTGAIPTNAIAYNILLLYNISRAHRNNFIRIKHDRRTERFIRPTGPSGKKKKRIFITSDAIFSHCKYRH